MRKALSYLGLAEEEYDEQSPAAVPVVSAQSPARASVTPFAPQRSARQRPVHERDPHRAPAPIS